MLSALPGRARRREKFALQMWGLPSGAFPGGMPKSMHTLIVLGLMDKTPVTPTKNSGVFLKLLVTALRTHTYLAPSDE